MMGIMEVGLDALDKTTAETVRDEICRLRKNSGFSDQETAKAIIAALRELEKLGTSNSAPDYECSWVPPFYALWYQNSHTQLAWRIINMLPGSSAFAETDGASSLKTVDFACGTMAMQFALAMASARRLHNDGTQVAVNIYSSDASRSMQSFGRRLWKAFYHILEEQNDEHSRALLRAIHLSIFQFGYSDQRVAAQIHMLSVMHAVYDESTDKIEEAIIRVINKLKPDIVVVTTHKSKESLAFKPSDIEYERAIDSDSTTWQLTGLATAVDDVRRQIYEEMISDVDGISEEDGSFARGYLTGDSLRRQAKFPQDTAISIYVRNDSALD